MLSWRLSCIIHVHVHTGTTYNGWSIIHDTINIWWSDSGRANRHNIEYTEWHNLVNISCDVVVVIVVVIVIVVIVVVIVVVVYYRDGSIECVRRQRNELCSIMNLPVPKSKVSYNNNNNNCYYYSWDCYSLEPKPTGIGIRMKWVIEV